MNEKLVIALAGPIASGKTTIGEYFSSKYGFQHLRSSSYLKQKLIQENKEITEFNLQELGKKIVSQIGGAGLSELVLLEYDNTRHLLYDSLRHVEDIYYFKNRFGSRFKLIFLETDSVILKERYQRRVNRDSSEESYNIRLSHPIEREVSLLRENADTVIINNNLLETITQMNGYIQNWTSK